MIWNWDFAAKPPWSRAPVKHPRRKQRGFHRNCSIELGESCPPTPPNKDAIHPHRKQWGILSCFREGIGMAIAHKLAEEGVRAAICARTESKLKATAEDIARATGVDIVPIAADLRSLAGCQGFVEQAAAQLGGVDILVNNAGASAFGAFVDLPDDAFVDAINGKLLGYIRCAKAAIPHMQRRGGGVIINITGTTQQAVPLHTPGSACNAAIRMFSKELSIELGPLNIRVNSIAPGRIQTTRSDRLLEANAESQGTTPEAILSDLVKTIPSGRVGSIDDIADAVLFLASERATYINGSALVVDGSKSLVI